MLATIRMAPPRVLSRPTRIVQRNMLVYRHSMVVIVSGFFEPLFYLFSMGFGVGALIGTVPLDNGTNVPYAQSAGRLAWYTARPSARMAST